MVQDFTSRPVSLALSGYRKLLEKAGEKPTEKLPSERALASQWGLSHAAVNRAATQLIAQGRLRRVGYALYPMAYSPDALGGARIAVLTHRSRRFAGLTAEAARRGVAVTERFYVGRDSLRLQLRGVIDERFDGVIFRLSDGGWEWDAEAEELDRLGIPFVVAEIAPNGTAVAAEDWAEAAGQLVAHLAAEGHAELAFLGSLRRAHRSNVVRHAYEERCLRLGLGASAGRILELAAHNREAMEAVCATLAERHPEATALVVYDEDHAAAAVAALRATGLAVPKDISVVTVGDGANARNAKPPVSAAMFDSGQLGHLVLDQLCRLIEQVRAVGRTTTRPRVLLGATLHRRSSVRNLGEGVAVDDDEGLMNRNSRVWPKEAESRRREAAMLRERTHRLSRGTAASEFTQLDMSGVANRSLTRQNGWLGQFPLLHFPSGRQTVHGVPFEVLNEKANDGKSALVLRSQRLSSQVAGTPVQMSIPVGARVRAVYFLHGCGFVGTPAPFAWYDFVMKGRRTVSLPLVARGLGQVDEKGGPVPNIQDWWNDFPQIEGPGVLPMVVTEDGDPFLYERYLYTLEWQAPEAGVFLEEIRISSNPAQPTTLGVLAVTLLKG